MSFTGGLLRNPADDGEPAASIQATHAFSSVLGRLSTDLTDVSASFQIRLQRHGTVVLHVVGAVEQRHIALAGRFHQRV